MNKVVTMNIVLVCVDNFQEYILINIRQLIRLKHKDIFVITNTKFFGLFNEFKKEIILVSSDNLVDYYNYKPAKNIDISFRNGFWGLTSQRFFYLHSFMKQRNIENVMHVENDVLIYYNCDILTKSIDMKKMCVPADSFHRSIASILFVPNFQVFGLFLDKYNNQYNDMNNLSGCQRIMPELFDNFPICASSEQHSSEQLFVTRNFKRFNMIFDAAGMGQYLGGIDPRNNPNDTVGFVNETSVIKYDKYQFVWQSTSGQPRKPFIKCDNQIIPIFNLHIHSKRLSDFV